MRLRLLVLGLGVAAVLASADSASAGDGVVALQTADPACGNDSGSTYVDCGNGTVTDNRTGLVWLANADCFDGLDWYQAREIVGSLSDIPPQRFGSILAGQDCGLSDGSSPAEWRLPSIVELMAMVRDADGDPGELDCDPTITNDQGDECWSVQCSATDSCSFVGVQSAYYWSATSYWGADSSLIPGVAWVEGVQGHDSAQSGKSSQFYVWPVRGGQ